MQRLYEFIGQHRAYFALGLAVVISFTLMGLGHSDKLALGRGVASGLLAAGQKVFAWPIESCSGLRYENAVFREQNTRLSLELMKLREAQLENERLRGLLDFQASHAGASSYLTGRVIARDPDRVANTIVIDVGSIAGVKDRRPVVTADGLVGRVLEVYPWTTVVQLLLDPNCRVSAIVQRPERTQGIVAYENGRFTLQHVPVRGEIEVGDRVVSSGLGGIFPKGLLVGEVVELGTEEQGLFRDVVLEPGVNFSSLEEVFVLDEAPPAARLFR